MLDFFQIYATTVVDKAVIIAGFFVAITALVFVKTGHQSLQWEDSLRQSGRVNVMLLLINLFAIMIPLLAAVYTVKLLQSVPHLSPLVWDDAPWFVRALVALLAFDLANYVAHRWMHANRWFWPLHAVHHSDTDLHFLSASRAHLFEWVILFPTAAIAAFLCGLSLTDVAFLALMREIHQYYVHSRLDWSHGPLRHVIAGPRFHRWHHVDQPEAYNKNFALFFPFIDVVFGTYHMPGPAKHLPTGFPGNPGEDFTKLLLFPFAEWGRLSGELSRKNNKQHVSPQ
ncbi:MAG: sterol desaturase family protein [Pseudomonadota bacterium]